MSVELIGLVTLAIGILVLFRGASFAVLAFVPMCLLGSAGAVLLGGAGTIQPAHLMLAFLVLAVFADPRQLEVPLRSMTFPREGFWLVVTMVYGVVGAYFLPRLFAGVTSVNAIGSTAYGASLLLVPLGPASGNITQSVYMVADVVCFMAMLAFGSTRRGFDILVTAVMSYCAGNIAFAIIDMATAATNTGFLLEIIRNADYQLHDEETTGGMRRIIGSFTETASFSYATIGSLGFTARLMLAGYWPRWTGTLSLVSLLLLAFSTSSTAYIATPALLMVLYGSACTEAVRRGARPATFVILAIAPLVLVVSIVAVVLDPATSAGLREFLDVTLLSKSTSQSGLERAQWNIVALQNFRDTWGMGGGLGSIRASSFPLAILSNLGLVGALGFAAFFSAVFLRSSEYQEWSGEAEVKAAARMACIGFVIAASVSGALVDLGLPFYVFAALACAAPGRSAIPRTVSPAVVTGAAPGPRQRSFPFP